MCDIKKKCCIQWLCISVNGRADGKTIFHIYVNRDVYENSLKAKFYLDELGLLNSLCHERDTH